MTEEQIKQTSKITEFARNMVKQSNYPIDLQDHIIATCMVVVTEATKELEKENAELKHTIATLRQEKDNVSMHSKAMEVVAKTKSDQLTKAKELLERLLITSCNSDVLNLLPNCSEVLRVRVEAEQFLSEVEK